MNLLKGYRTRKYLHQMLLTITLLTVVFVSISTTAFYWVAERNSIETQTEANLKILRQLQYNIHYMSELVQNLAVSLFFDNSLNTLMYKDVEQFDVISKLNRLDQTVSSTAFLDSVLFYNANLDKTYTSFSGATLQSERRVKQLEGLLRNNPQQEKLRLLPITDTEGKVDVFTLLLYESRQGTNKTDGVLALNIKPEWLFDNIRTVNSSSGAGSLYIVNRSGTVLNAAASDPVTAWLPKALEGRPAVSESGDTFTFQSADSGKVLVSTVSDGQQDWMIVSVQSYDTFLRHLQRMRLVLAIVAIALLAVSFFVSIWVSRKLYLPVDRLMKEIQTERLEEGSYSSEDWDELAYMSRMYKSITGRLRQMKVEDNAKRNIVGHYYAKRLLTESSTVSVKSFLHRLRENRMNLKETGPYTICLIKLDNFAYLEQHIPPEEVKLYRFAIHNIAQEILKRKYQAELVDMGTDHIVAIVSTGDIDHDTGTWNMLLKDIQHQVHKYYRMSLTIALSNAVDEHFDISKAYHEALKNAMYRLRFGRMQIIHPDMVSNQYDSWSIELPAEWSKKLADEIRSHNKDGMKEATGKLFEYIGLLQADNMIHSILQVVAQIQNTVFQMNQNRLYPVIIDLTPYYKGVFEQETLDDMLDMFFQLYDDLGFKLAQQSDLRRNTLLADSVKDYIHREYADLNLCQQSIADSLHITSSYLGKLFKASVGVTVTEYMNDYRMTEAQKLLANPQMGINDVMTQVGYSNQSYFFRQFKKKFGGTPKEYRLKAWERA